VTPDPGPAPTCRAGRGGAGRHRRLAAVQPQRRPRPRPLLPRPRPPFTPPPPEWPRPRAVPEPRTAPSPGERPPGDPGTPGPRIPPRFPDPASMRHPSARKLVGLGPGTRALGAGGRQPTPEILWGWSAPHPCPLSRWPSLPAPRGTLLCASHAGWAAGSDGGHQDAAGKAAGNCFPDPGNCTCEGRESGARAPWGRDGSRAPSPNLNQGLRNHPQDS
jgi:translation initiation factor IF-2